MLATRSRCQAHPNPGRIADGPPLSPPRRPELRLRLAPPRAHGQGRSELRTCQLKNQAGEATQTGRKVVSGNPGGRPRAIVEVQELARRETAASIAALVRIRDAEDTPPAAVVAAATALIARQVGCPVALPQLNCSHVPKCCLIRIAPQRGCIDGSGYGANQHGDTRRVGGCTGRSLRIEQPKASRPYPG